MCDYEWVAAHGSVGVHFVHLQQCMHWTLTIPMQHISDSALEDLTQGIDVPDTHGTTIILLLSDALHVLCLETSPSTNTWLSPSLRCMRCIRTLLAPMNLHLRSNRLSLG